MKGMKVLAILYIFAAVCFDISFYSWIFASYNNYEGPLYLVIGFTLLISLLILGFPSRLYIRGFNYTLIDILDYIKIIQLFIIFVVMPSFRDDGFLILLIMLILITLANWIFQLRIFRHLTHTSFVEMADIIKIQPEKKIKNKHLIRKALIIILPLFLWLLVDEFKMLLLFIWIVIILLEFVLINNLYQNFLKQFNDQTSKSDFSKTTVKVLIAFSILIFMSIYHPESIFNFLMMGFIPAQFVNLIHRSTFRKTVNI